VMSIAGELLRLSLAAAIESDCILLPSGTICKYYLYSTESSATFSTERGLSGGDS
jgi:hypothetical protein